MHAVMEEVAPKEGSGEAPVDPMLDIVASIAAMCHEANRKYCQSQGDETQVPWDEAPKWQKESAIAGVNMIRKNRIAVPEDSHKAWLAQKLEEGWKYGPVKNHETKEHPCIAEYSSLPEFQRMKDHIFNAIAKAMIDFHNLWDTTDPSQGQVVMNVDFNPGGNPSVKKIKLAFADLFDLLNQECDSLYHKIMASEDRSPETLMSNDNRLRQVGHNMAQALNYLEDAQMRAVKSITR